MNQQEKNICLCFPRVTDCSLCSKFPHREFDPVVHLDEIKAPASICAGTELVVLVSAPALAHAA